MKIKRKKLTVIILLVVFVCTSGFYVVDWLNATNNSEKAEAADITSDVSDSNPGSVIIGGADEPTSILLADSNNVSETGTVEAALPEKDETVYVNLNNDGTVSKINVVNHFKTREAGIIKDFGNYDSLVNLSDETAPVTNGDEIQWNIQSPAEDFYYQGQLKSGELPWNFTIQYQLDGKNISASELAGASGELLITIDAKENQLSGEYFRKNYMMQITVPVNMQNSTLISAPGAVPMIAGHTETLAFTLLPQSSGHFVIKTKVQDFTMDGIDIAMMKADMTSYFDIDKMTQGFNTMSGGMSDLANGTLALKDGISQLSGGIGSLSGGVNDLSQGTGRLSDGMDQLGQGMADFAGGLDSLAAGSSKMKDGLNGLADNGSQLLAGYQGAEDGLASALANKDQLTALANELAKSSDPQTAMLAQAMLGQLGGMSELQTGLENLNSNLDQYLQGVNQVAGKYAALDSGINALPEGFDKLSGGFNDIKDGNKAVYSGISDINKGLSDINTAASQIPDQIQKLADGQKSMKDGVDTAIAEIKDLTGTSDSQASGQTVSFAAPGKITPNSVQFVLRTPAIEKVTVQEDNSGIKEKKESFWDRLIKLF